MLRRFDDDGNWIEDMTSKWPQETYIVDTKEHKGVLIVWSFYEHEVLNFQDNVNRNYIFSPGDLGAVCSELTGSGG